MEFILPECYEVSFEPLFEHKPFWSVVNYRLAFTTRPSQLSHSSRTGTKPCTCFTWYRYRMWSDLIPVRMFRTGMRTGVNSYRYNISYRYHVNEYSATSGHQDKLVLEWNLYRYHVNTPKNQLTPVTPFCLSWQWTSGVLLITWVHCKSNKMVQFLLIMVRVLSLRKVRLVWKVIVLESTSFTSLPEVVPVLARYSSLF